MLPGVLPVCAKRQPDFSSSSPEDCKVSTYFSQVPGIYLRSQIRFSAQAQDNSTNRRQSAEEIITEMRTILKKKRPSLILTYKNDLFGSVCLRIEDQGVEYCYTGDRSGVGSYTSFGKTVELKYEDLIKHRHGVKAPKYFDTLKDMLERRIAQNFGLNSLTIDLDPEIAQLILATLNPEVPEHLQWEVTPDNLKLLRQVTQHTLKKPCLIDITGYCLQDPAQRVHLQYRFSEAGREYYAIGRQDPNRGSYLVYTPFPSNLVLVKELMAAIALRNREARILSSPVSKMPVVLQTQHRALEKSAQTCLNALTGITSQDKAFQLLREMAEAIPEGSQFQLQNRARDVWARKLHRQKINWGNVLTSSIRVVAPTGELYELQGFCKDNNIYDKFFIISCGDEHYQIGTKLQKPDEIRRIQQVAYDKLAQLCGFQKNFTLDPLLKVLCQGTLDGSIHWRAKSGSKKDFQAWSKWLTSGDLRHQDFQLCLQTRTPSLQAGHRPLTIHLYSSGCFHTSHTYKPEYRIGIQPAGELEQLLEFSGDNMSEIGLLPFLIDCIAYRHLHTDRRLSQMPPSKTADELFQKALKLYAVISDKAFLKAIQEALLETN